MIQLNDNYYLDVDTYNFILIHKHLSESKKKNADKSKYIFEAIGYYSTVSKLYGAIIEHKMKLHPTVLTNVTELLAIKKDVMDMVSNSPSINEQRKEYLKI